MGENEQGGMLRVVVVLGLIALIAGVIIGGVVYAKNNMQDKIVGTASLVDKVIKDNQSTPAITEGDVPVDAWQNYDSSKTYTIKSGQHLAFRYDNTPTVDSIDGNVYASNIFRSVLLLKDGETAPSVVSNSSDPLADAYVARGLKLNDTATIGSQDLKFVGTAFQTDLANLARGERIMRMTDYLLWIIHTGGTPDANGDIIAGPDDRANMSLLDYANWYYGEGADLVSDADWMASHHFVKLGGSSSLSDPESMILSASLGLYETNFDSFQAPNNLKDESYHIFAETVVDSAHYSDEFGKNFLDVSEDAVDLADPSDSTSIDRLRDYNSRVSFGKSSDFDDKDTTFKLDFSGQLSAGLCQIAIW